MDKFKQQIQLQLTANILKSKCNSHSDVIFDESLCLQERIIRFTTPTLLEKFPAGKTAQGKKSTVGIAMYEVHNGIASLEIECVFKDTVLRKWTLTSGTQDINDLLVRFDEFLDVDRVEFEKELMTEETPEDIPLTEGSPEEIFSKKYERNAKARKKCLEYHGTACKVCGIDFAKAYGQEFAGKIEVHHIVPICQIGEEYEVDPINDLVPVCPNCHTALHSKKNGVYTIEELKQLRNQV